MADAEAPKTPTTPRSRTTTPPPPTTPGTADANSPAAAAAADSDDNGPSTPPSQTLPSSATVERTRAREDTPVRLPPQSIGKPPKTPDFRTLLKESTPKSQSASKLGFGNTSGNRSAGVMRSWTPQGRSQINALGGARMSPATGLFHSTPGDGAPKPANKPAGLDFDDDVAAKIGVVKWDSDSDEDMDDKIPRKRK